MVCESWRRYVSICVKCFPCRKILWERCRCVSMTLMVCECWRRYVSVCVKCFPCKKNVFPAKKCVSMTLMVCECWRRYVSVCVKKQLFCSHVSMCEKNIFLWERRRCLSTCVQHTHKHTHTHTHSQAKTKRRVRERQRQRTLMSASRGSRRLGAHSQKYPP